MNIEIEIPDTANFTFTVGKNKKLIEEYIRNQSQEEMIVVE